jgi:F0F1-type ATP synthase delta subunit
LIINFPEFDSELIAVVRQVEVKYKKPAKGQVNSTAILTDNTIDEIKEQLRTRKRASVRLKIELYDINKINVMTGIFEWFVTVLTTNT